MNFLRRFVFQLVNKQNSQTVFSEQAQLRDKYYTQTKNTKRHNFVWDHHLLYHYS